MINLLLTSVNWRAELVKIFRKKIKEICLDNKVVTTDIDPLAAGIYQSDNHYMVPLYVNPDYPRVLKEICKKERIDFIIPQTDRDCNYFAEHRQLIESWGVTVLMPDSQFINILNDKKKCQNFLSDHNILIPRNFNSIEEVN
ncbi:MAG: hypothetical protein ACLFQV_02580 [Vulcanimicrobiota bacterium]